MPNEPMSSLPEQTPEEIARLEEERRRIAENNALVEREMARRSRRSFLVGGLATLGGLGVWEWIRTRPQDLGQPWPLRRVLDINEEFSRDLFTDRAKAPQFPLSAVRKPFRLNERIGMDDPLVPSEWKLVVDGYNTDEDEAHAELDMEAIHKMPRTEETVEFKCIEGWSQTAHWAGVKFADFAKQYPAPEGYDYVGMETPDAGYYVGLDLASAMHPQTLLAYELDGDALPEPHGAPLRLMIPTKYGIKNLKRIGRIFYSQERPRDYWAEQGYDWYAGL